MRAIIIDDKDAVALLDQLKLEKLEESPMRPEVSRAVIDVIHRQFHYVVTKWLQDQGCDVTTNR